MKLGIFGGARQKRGLADTDSPTGYRDWIEYNIEAEALDFCSSFTTEHHFTGLGQVSASLKLMTYFAAKTTTLRPGTAVMPLPWHNPVLLAEQAATLDLVSDGRLYFGVVKGYRCNEFHVFGVDVVDADEIFVEALALILKSWQTEERWSHKGKHWQFNEIVVEPPIVQEPHPPIWLTAGRPGSIRASARRGRIFFWTNTHRCMRCSSVPKSSATSSGKSVSIRKTVRSPLRAACSLQKTRLRKRTSSRGDRRREILSTSWPKSRTATTRPASCNSKDRKKAIDGVLIGTLDEIAERLEVIRQGGIEYLVLSNVGGGAASLRQFSEAFI